MTAPALPAGFRLFQIGFNKCATRSISHFFKRHGLSVADWGRGALALSIRDAVEAGTTPLAEWPDTQVFSDMEQINRRDLIEGYRYFKELDAAYPEARFILNTRNMEAWIRSRHAHGDGGYTDVYRHYYDLPDVEAVWDRWREEWLRHHLAVLTYFSGPRRHKLFLWDIDAPDFDGLERLVGFPVRRDLWGHRGRTDNAPSPPDSPPDSPTAAAEQGTASHGA